MDVDVQSAKIQLLTWFIVIIIVICLFFRNCQYDVALALFLLFLASVLLVLYGSVYNIANVDFMIIIISLLATLLLSAALTYYSYIQSVDLWYYLWSLLCITIAAVLIYYILVVPDTFLPYVYIIWLLLFLCLWLSNITHVGLLVLFLFVLIVSLLAYFQQSSYFNILIIGIALISWLLPYKNYITHLQ